jgi:hypothetical protein
MVRRNYTEDDVAEAILVLKQKGVDCVVVGSKLHVSERSTAPYIVSTS